MYAVVLAIAALGAPPEDSGKYHTFRYNDRSHPQLTMHDWRFVWSQEHVYNPAVKFGGNPNLEPPWRVNGGMDRVPQMASEKKLLVPKGKFIEVWIEKQPRSRTGSINIDYRKYCWKYPVGTIVSETISSRGKPFMRRIRMKVRDGVGEQCWEGDEVNLGPIPKAVTPIGDCRKCHVDVGRDVSFLAGEFLGRDWYGFVRGHDGIFSFRPIDRRGRLLKLPFLRMRRLDRRR